MRRVRGLIVAAVLFSAASPALAQSSDAVEARRPAALVPLYVAQVTLHGLDLHSTMRALDQGHREANPFLKNATSGQMIGAKIATSAATVWLSEKLWKKNRVAAVVVMSGVNAALAAVVANNYRIAESTRR